MKRVMFITVMTALLSGPVMAALNLPGTGTDTNVDQVDDNYALFTGWPDPDPANPEGSPGDAYLRTPHDAWVPPGDDYSWIGPTAGDAGSITDPAGYYWYQLAAGQLIGGTGVYHFEGDWAADNGAVLLSDGGTYTEVASLPGPFGFSSLTHFSFNANVNWGETLYFRVLNAEGESGNPTGLLVENFTVSAVPVPGAVLLGFLGLGVAGLKLRKLV